MPWGCFLGFLTSLGSNPAVLWWLNWEVTPGYDSLSPTVVCPKKPQQSNPSNFGPCTGCTLGGSKGCKTNKVPCSLPSGKESESEDLNSGSVSMGLLDTPSLTDPEKSPSPTPVTASPIHDEFNVNIHEEVSFFFPFIKCHRSLKILLVLDSYFRWQNSSFWKDFFLGCTVFCNVSYPFGESSFLVKAAEEFQLNLFFLVLKWDQKTANSCILSWEQI